MICSLRTNFITFAIIKLGVVQLETNVDKYDIYDSLITDIELFPYIVAILQRASYLSAGAIISDLWILTAADALYTVRESIRQLRVRIGSVNYQKGGEVLPIKYFRIHPYFEDRLPIYDLALIRLSLPVSRTSYASPIRLKWEINSKFTATHFIVTTWTNGKKDEVSSNIRKSNSTQAIQRNKVLKVRQMHSMDTDECRLQQHKLRIFESHTLLCLDPNIGTDWSERHVVAPVVSNGMLWGIVSSWRQDDCQSDPGPTYVNLISSPNVASWIDAVMRDLHWKLQKIHAEDENYI